MTSEVRKLLLWTPQLLGIAVALFIGAFALHAVREGPTALLIHAAPAILVVVVLMASWRREWFGGVAFIGLAVIYAVSAWRRPDWVLIISGPLLVVGILFLWSWRHRDELHVRA